MAVIIYWAAMIGVAILVITAMLVKSNAKYSKKFDNWYSIILVTLLVIAVISGNIYSN